MPYPMKIFFRRVQVIGVFFTFCPEKFFSRTALISFRIINYLELKDHLQFSWSITPIFSLPGQKSRRRRQKGPGSNLPISSFFLSAMRRGGKGIAKQQGAEARMGERGTTAFFGEAHAFLPGQGTTWPYRKSSIHKTG